MPIALEIAELIRALDFPGADLFLFLSMTLVIAIAFSITAPIRFWLALLLLASVPTAYALTSGRAEIANIGLSFALFFLLLEYLRRPARMLSLRARSIIFITLVLSSRFLGMGDPIYIESSFNSLFYSGNAFIYYLLITACIIAFNVRIAFVTAALAIPLAWIQTKSVVILTLSHRTVTLLTIALSYPLIIAIASQDRFSWFIENYGVIYAIGSGRIQRLIDRASDTFSTDVLLYGSPLNSNPENFEIEFIDLINEFGVPFTALFFFIAIAHLRRNTRQDFGKILALFLLLNLSGHFWNNPLLVVTFTILVAYVNRRNKNHNRRHRRPTLREVRA